MELFWTEIELLLLDWQLDGPNVPVVWFILLFLAMLVIGYVFIQFLLLEAKWSAVLQLFSRASIIIPPNNNWWVVGIVLGVLVILGAFWWVSGY
jgi:hypothetical protein